jgi:large subunit ribosomal protein L14
MIVAGTNLEVSDNSGAKLVQCIQKSGTQWTIGDIITVAVKKARGTKVASGSVQKAVIVEVKKGINRADGSKLRFDRNACVLVSDKGQPIGTRVLGFVTHELRTRNMLKVLSLASRVL